MKCKNNKCNNTLTKKQKRFCSQSCHYTWKKLQPSKLNNKLNELNNIKKYAASLTNKDDIYQFICDNISRFNTNSNLNECARIEKMINDYSLKIHLNVSTWKELYNYLKGKSKCEICNLESKFDTFTHGYYRFCSNECKHKWRSLNMIGDKNNFHKVSKEVRKRIGKENSKRLKKMISNGTFTPNITNSWTKSRCNIKINEKHIKLRSSWEAYFQLFNPTFKYEALRIPYEYNNEWHNYIIDFIDYDSKCIYEIKPTSELNNRRIKIKRKAAIKWANDNGYDYIEITEDWFYSNYKESLLNGQPEENHLKKLLRQFI